MTASLHTGVAADETTTEPDYSLRMSTSLTWDATAGGPIAPAGIESFVAPVAMDATVSRGSRSYLLAVLSAALGLVIGAWLTWRKPKELTPSQDRLGAELMRSRERYLGLLNQRSQRRDPDWDSTVNTLNADLALARGITDRLRDEKSAVETELQKRSEQVEAATQTRVQLEENLAGVRDDLANARTLHQAEQARAQTQLEAAQASAMQLQASLKSSQAEARSQREIIVELSQRADEAAIERKRADGLAAALAGVSASLEQAEQRLALLDTTATDAAATLAEMLDKNLALEAELSRLREQQRQTAQERSHSEIELAEQLRLVQETAAHQEAQFESTLAAARTDQAQRVAALEDALADERAARAQSERQLREELAAAAQQTAQSEQAKRRVLSILQQEKIVVGEMQTELERLHLEHTTALEQHEAMQKMLATAEDRIDDQKTQIADLYEENQVLRNELVEKEQHLAKLQAPSAGARTGEPPRTLADAQRTIRQLRADLRLRGDLVDKLTADVDAEAAAQAALRERNEEVAVLQNELTMALGEASRLRQRLETQPRVTPRDLVILRERIDGLEDRIRAKEKEIAILRTAANDDIDGSPLRDHVTGLERDQEASIAVVRFLEGEVKKLSAELRPTGVV